MYLRYKTLLSFGIYEISIVIFVMLHEGTKENEGCSVETRGRPIKFLSSLFKKKKTCSAGIDVADRVQPTVHVARVPSTLSVKDIMISACPTSPATPARHRDIDADMEALRISRHDNPFLKQVLASRESLADSLEESESDDINLMSQEFLSELETDPMSLPEVHEHMIRSPPPTSWPRSPNFKMFRFPDSEQDSSQENLSQIKSPAAQSISPRSELKCDFLSQDEGKTSGIVLSPRINLPSRQYQRSTSDIRERNLTLLTPAPLRSLTDVRRLHRSEDSQQLVPSDS